jgi:putative ABC transport system substrate-binding protein
MGVQLLPLELRSPDELEAIMADATTGGADGLLVVAGPLFSFLAPRIVALAAQLRVPAIYSNSTFADPGGLLVYAANLTANYRRAATYVDKILKGAKPADLPIEQPTIFDFVVNLKTARAQGLTIPPSVLQQATEVIH